jgi:hypothetical protein
MALIIQEDPNKFPLPPEGLHKAVCVDAVDLGELDTRFGSKHKLSLIFELEEVDQEGKRFIVGKRYTWSLNEKSNLRKDLERWLGRKFKSEELIASGSSIVRGTKNPRNMLQALMGLRCNSQEHTYGCAFLG